MADAGSDIAFDTPISQELKMNNLMLGQSTPANWPLGNLDNKIWIQNMAREGLHQMPELYEVPVQFTGGNLREGDRLYGTWDPFFPLPSANPFPRNLFQKH